MIEISICFNLLPPHNIEVAAHRSSVKKGVPRNLTKFTGKHLCQNLFFLIKLQDETLAQMFFCEFSKISKNTFSYRTPKVAAPEKDSLQK